MSVSLARRIVSAGWAAISVLSSLSTSTLYTRPAVAQGIKIEELVVTARRREERLQDVPLAVSALTAKDFQALNLTDLKDISKLIPSLQINTVGQSNTRNRQALFIRGVSRGGVGIFINGAPGGSAAATLGDLERIEVLKGPQNAYFGRSTFSGAINYVTKTPSDTWGGSAEAVAGNYARVDVRASVEGPIVEDALSFRVSGRQFSQQGQYTNSFDGTRMTDQSTRSISGVLDLHKGDNLSVVLVGLFDKLEDGVPIAAKLKAVDFNCNAGVAPVGQNNYICGKLPRIPESRIGLSTYTTNLPGFPAHDILFKNSLNFPNPSNVKPIIDGFDNLVYTLASNLRADYTFANGSLLDGITLSYLVAVNGSKSNFMLNAVGEDTSGTPNPNFGRIFGATPSAANVNIIFGGWNYEIYHELRAAGDQSDRIRWMVGTSYSKPINRVYQMNYGVTTNGPAAFVTNYNNFNNTYTKPIGIFGSLSFDITDDLTANAEARYQYDKITVVRQAPAPTASIAESKGWKLMPRMSLQYDYNPDMNSYVSWARGFQPASFNAILFTQPASNIAIVQQATGAGTTVSGEQMDMYELGLKGGLLGGRLVINTDIYYGLWTNQIIQQRVNAPNPTAPGTITVITVNTNLGETEVKGWELDAAASLSDKISSRVTFAYNDMTIKKYFCAACQQNLTGSADVAGKRLSGSPQLSGSAIVEYRDTFREKYEWFLATTFIFTGKIYADDVNLAWTSPRKTFDFRGGLDFGNIVVEAYVVNAFNSYYYDGASRDINFGNTGPAAFNNVVYVNPPEKRRVGLRATYRWGG